MCHYHIKDRDTYKSFGRRIRTLIKRLTSEIQLISIPEAFYLFSALVEPTMTVWQDDDVTEPWREYMANIDGLDVDLSNIPFELSDERKRTAASVYHKTDPSGYTVGGKNEIHVTKIRFSIDAFEKFSEEEWLDTLRHECVHVYTVQEHNTGGHGSLFYKYADLVDCGRHCPKFSDAKYEMVCETCNNCFVRRHNICKVVRHSLLRRRYHTQCHEDPEKGDGYLKLVRGIDEALDRIDPISSIDNYDNFDRSYYGDEQGVVDEGEQVDEQDPVSQQENVDQEESVNEQEPVDEQEPAGPADTVDFDRQEFFG